MSIEDFKRWHWIVLSLIAGSILAYARSGVDPETSETNRRSISPTDFVGMLIQPKTSKGFSRLTGIVVYPPIDRTSFVTGNMLEIQPNGKGMYKRFQFFADIPFQSSAVDAPDSSTFSIRDYIDRESKAYPGIIYRYAWWELRPAQWIICVAGSMIVIGGALPTLLNVLSGAGWGHKPRDDGPTFNLRNYHPSNTASAMKAKPTLTAADQEQIQRLQENLEQNLAGSGGGLASAGPVKSDAAPVKPLSSLPGQPMQIPTDDAGDKEYGGEFYPVARPAHHDEAQPDE